MVRRSTIGKQFSPDFRRFFLDFHSALIQPDLAVKYFRLIALKPAF
jgi:hypothetical protein